MADDQREQLADVLREIVGDRTQRSVALQGGVSHTYLNEWIQGRTPSRRMLARFARRLAISGTLRARLFAAAELVDPGDEDADPPAKIIPRERIDAAIGQMLRDLVTEYGPGAAGVMGYANFAEITTLEQVEALKESIIADLQAEQAETQARKKQ